MKAVILEIIKERAVVMKSDGTVRRVRNKNYSIGDEIYMKEGIFSHRKWAPIVAALLIFAMVGTGTWAYADGYELNAVDKDGIEFMIMVNKRDMVTSVEVDGVEIKFEEEFENKDVEGFLRELFENHKIKAIAPIADSEEEEEQIAAMIKEMLKNENAVEAQERNKERKETQEELVSQEDPLDENIRVKGLSPEDVERAKFLEMTPGHYNIITNLMEVEDEWKNITDDPDGSFEKYTGMTKQEIMEEFSARDGEKNNPSVNAPGQEDKAEKEKKDKDIPLGQIKEKTVVEFEELDDDLEEDTDDSERPESPGKSNEAPGRN